MIKKYIIILLLVITCAAVFAAERRNNFFRSKSNDYILPTVLSPVKDGVRLDIPGELGNRELARMGFVDITAAPFRADPKGKKDSTPAIQAAVNFARDHQMVCFFPTGNYLVSDTISCIQKLYKRTNGAVNAGRNFPCVLMGSIKGERPKFILAPSSPGYQNPRKPKYVIHFWARTPLQELSRQRLLQSPTGGLSACILAADPGP